MNSLSRSNENVASVRKPTRWEEVPVPLLPLGNAERRLALVIVDLILLSSALIISVALRTQLLSDPAAIIGYGKWFLTLVVVWAVVTSVFDAYNLARAASTTYGLFAGAASAFATSLIYQAIPWLTPALENRTQAVLFIVVATIAVSAWRVTYARLFSHPAFQRRALIVGADQDSQVLAEALQRSLTGTTPNPFRGTGYILLGFIDSRAELRGESLAGLPVLGDADDLIRLARTLNADEVIVAPDEMMHNGASLYDALLDCRELGIPVTNLTSLYERLTGRVTVEYATRDLESVTGHSDSALLRSSVFAKRLIDILLAIGAIGPLLLAMAFVAVANALTAPGPLFFRQQRVGQGGRPFKIIKFRTMVPEAEKASGAVWAGKNDDRATPMGRWLRRTHLDELPQVLNILRGEMSIVGPRPERPEFVGRLSGAIPFYRARHSVLPGITGWAQIHQSYGDSVELAREKLEYDLFYVKHASFLLDMLIILRTVATMVGLRGR